MNLKTKYLGKNLFWYNEIDSTQKEIYRLIEKQTPNGTLVGSEIQTDGIGTHGRKWYTTNTNNIAISFVLYPNCNVSKLEGLTIEIASILVGIFKETYNIKIDIKEPNDLMINGKKVAGILTQTKLRGEIVDNLVIGIGMNLSQEIFDDEIKEIATSIKREYKVDINREIIIEKLLEKLEERYEEKIK
ncbi:Bifunctional ligase/repressor BirA [compost metagenome]